MVLNRDALNIITVRLRALLSGGAGTFKKNAKKSTKKVPKRASSPAKTEVIQEKLKKTTQPHEKLKFLLKKWQKIDKTFTKKTIHLLKNTEFLNWKLGTVLQIGILKKKIPTPNFTKLLNP